MYIQCVTLKNGHTFACEMPDKRDEDAFATFGADNIECIEYKEVSGND